MKKPGTFNDLVPMDDPQTVFAEACRIVAATPVKPDFTLLSMVFADVVNLSGASIPGIGTAILITMT